MNAKKMANYTNNAKAQELWKTLYLCAKESKTRRFHALYVSTTILNSSKTSTENSPVEA